jgi:hypothetical protein
MRSSVGTDVTRHPDLAQLERQPNRAPIGGV